MTARKPQRKTRTRLPATTTLKIDPDAVFRVQLQRPPKAENLPRKGMRAYVIALFLAGMIYFSLVAFYVWPRAYEPLTAVEGIPRLAISLSFPRYLNFGDVGEIDVTIVNQSDTTISGSLVLAFSGSLPVETEPSNSTALMMKDLEAGARISERLHVLVDRPLWLSAASTEFQVLVAANGQRGLLPKKPKSHYLIDAAPLPYLNTPLFALLSISPILIGALLPLLLDFLKQRLDSKRE